MADFLAIPPAVEVRGTVEAPPSKSATNRALVLAALSETPVDIERPLDSADTRALIGCLSAMGVSFEASSEGLRVSGPPAAPRGGVILDAGESGTAARFLTALAAAVEGDFLLTGSPRLRERPVGELVAALASLGAVIGFVGETGGLPLKIRGGRLHSGRVAVDASRSSQFLSALLLVAPAVPGGIEVSPSSPVASSPYVGMTIEALRSFGHDVAGGLDAGAIRVSRGRTPASYRVPGDYSSAVPLLASAGAAGGMVTVSGLTYPSEDADARALPVLGEMGVAVLAGPEGVSSRSNGKLRPVAVEATEFPDAVPALAALAALAPGESRFSGIAHLRLKESDRIASLASLLTTAGAGAEARDNSLVVKGRACPRRDGRLVPLPTFGDHRIAMAGALLSLALPGLLIEDPGCVAKSYPRFFRDLESLVQRRS